MLHRLPALSFVVVLLLSKTAGLAQVPVAAGTSGSALVATKSHVFVMHGGVLYKFDQKNLKLLAKVNLEAADAETVERVESERGEIIESAEKDPGEEPVARLQPPSATAVSEAVDAALTWLIRHQDEDGRWDADQFMKHDVAGAPNDGAGNPTKDIGVTGLATLAMLGHGSSLKGGPHREQINKAVEWLRKQQQDNGLIGTIAARDFIYGHAIAALALSEAYGLSHYKPLKPAAQKAIDYLESHRNPYGVWRYQPRDNDNDTSVTTWALMAYRSAKDFGLLVDPEALQFVGSWYDQVTDEHGRAGYNTRGGRSSRMAGEHATHFPPENGEAMTAAALFGRFLLGQKPDEQPTMNASAKLLLRKSPQWADGRIDPYYWWFGSQAMCQMGGTWWQQWSSGFADIVQAQRRDGNFTGSWDPVGVWDMDGGRVYATAMHALTLEIQRRLTIIKR